MWHGKTKHIKIHCHYITERVQKKEIEVLICKTAGQLQDIVTLALRKENFQRLIKMIGVKDKMVNKGVLV